MNLKSADFRKVVNEIKNHRKKQKKLIKKNFEQFEESMKQKYPDFSKNYPGIFDKAIRGTLGNMFEQMLSILKNMEEKKLTEHSASVKVGTILADKYVKPIIKEE